VAWGLVVAGAAVVIGGATTAQAADGGLTLDVQKTYYIENAATDGTASYGLDIGVGTSAGDGPVGRTLTFDASAFAGHAAIASVDAGNGCSADGLIVTCALPDGATHVAPVRLVPEQGAVSGFGADLPVTLSAPGAATVTARIHTVLGTPALLTAVLPERLGVPAGTVLPFSPVLGNLGDATSENGVRLHFHTSDPEAASATTRGFAAVGPRPDNCYYPPAPRTDFTCVFPEPLVPHAVYTTDRPLAYRTRAPLTDGAITYDISPTGITRPSLDFDPASYTRGTAAPLALRETTDPVPGGTGLPAGWLHVTSDTPVDYQAVGGTAHARPGQVATIDLGVRNVGSGTPAAVEHDNGSFAVTLPAGVTLVRTAATTAHGAAPQCTRTDPSAYRCALPGPVRAGAAYLVRFTVRVGRIVKDASGEVRIPPSVSGAVADRNPANDTAPLTVSLPAPPPAGDTSAGAGGPRNDPAPDGELSATGTPGTSTLAACAMGALAPGATAATATRRRRQA
jgi:hypothetical protein